MTNNEVRHPFWLAQNKFLKDSKDMNGRMGPYDTLSLAQNKFHEDSEDKRRMGHTQTLSSHIGIQSCKTERGQYGSEDHTNTLSFSTQYHHGRMAHDDTLSKDSEERCLEESFLMR